jgi:hypothetical protein
MRDCGLLPAGSAAQCSTEIASKKGDASPTFPRAMSVDSTDHLLYNK